MDKDAQLSELNIVPANQASWDDLKLIFGERGEPHWCQCQRFKMPSYLWHTQPKSEHFQERAERLQKQSNCGNPGAAETCGLVAYLDGEPAGWCRVEPRSSYVHLNKTPWTGRTEDPSDPSVWALSCFVIRLGYRNRHISYALTKAAVAYARDRGAKALEGYAMRTVPGKEITWGELHVGALGAYHAAGFTEVSWPSLRRVVMRVEF